MVKKIENTLQLEALRFAWSESSDFLEISDFALKQGQKVLLHGPSGVGKSTLLNIITGILAPTQGQVWVAGQSLWQLRAAKRDYVRAQEMGVITQSLNLVPYLSVLENLQLMLSFAHKSVSQAQIKQLLEALNLLPQAEQTVATLSVGQKQRAAIARALVHAPKLIIADEPTSALDRDNALAFMRLLGEQVAASGASLLMVSHDLSLGDYCDDTLSMQQLNRCAPKHLSMEAAC